jgi:carbon storage regulator
MLVLSRHKNESIFVGEAEVRILEVRGDKVRIGIEAPRDVPIDRAEVRRRKLAEARPAAPTSSPPKRAA